MLTNTIIFGCLQILLIATITEAICPYCLCTMSYKPLCAIQEKTGLYRTFNSECVLNCNNRCLKNKYEFYNSGRCPDVLNRKPITELLKRRTTSTTTEIPFVEAV